MQPKPSNDNQNEVESLEEDLVYTPDFVFLPKGSHSYKQEGPYLVCRGCELHHAIYIGMDKLMVGENEKGEPILKSKQEVFGK